MATKQRLQLLRLQDTVLERDDTVIAIGDKEAMAGLNS